MKPNVLWITGLTIAFLSLFSPIIVYLLYLTDINIPGNVKEVGPIGDFMAGTMVPILTFASTLILVSNLLDFRNQVKMQNKQFDVQLKHAEELQMKENRTLIDYSVINAPLFLGDTLTKNDIFLLHPDISMFIHHNDYAFLSTQRAYFIKLDFYGKSEQITDVNIEIELFIDKNNTVKHNLYKSGIGKEQSIFIPFALDGSDEQLRRIEISYSTLFMERIRFQSDLVKLEEEYYSILNNQEKLISRRDLVNESLIYPYWMDKER